jgi:hypothetical protein
MLTIASTATPNPGLTSADDASARPPVASGECPQGGAHAWIPVQGGTTSVCSKCGSSS